MIIRFTPDADAELAEARQWPSNGMSTNANTWTWSLWNVSTTLCRESFVILPCILSSTEISDARLFGVFPTLRFYEIIADEIQVIAVFHSRRDPEGWQSRVR